MSALHAWAQRVAVPLAALLAWYAVAKTGVFSAQALPSPVSVVARWWHYLAPAETYDASRGSLVAWIFSGELLGDAVSSLYRVLLGFVIGTGLALPLGLWMGASTRAYAFLNPTVQILRPIPPSAYIPLAILWFGLGNPPAVFLIVIGAFFPVLINTIAGVRNVEAIYLRAARNLGAGRLSLFTQVIVPAATPYILTGMRIGVGTAFVVVIVSEMIAVNNGLGFRILEAREYFWTDKVMAGMFTIGMIGLAVDSIMSRINRHLLRWHPGLST
jgi:NitT/TauT family transport system permease protein